MHLLLAQRGTVAEAGEAVDLGQSPADVVVLSSADTELASLSAAAGALRDSAPGLRLANLLRLAHPMSVDAYVARTLRHAKLVVVRLLGGAAYWPYGLEALLELAQTRGVMLCALPGDDKPDPSLERFSTVSAEARAFLWRCLIEGGSENAQKFLLGCGAVLGRGDWPAGAQPLLKAGVLGGAGRESASRVCHPLPLPSSRSCRRHPAPAPPSSSTARSYRAGRRSRWKLCAQRCETRGSIPSPSTSPA